MFKALKPSIFTQAFLDAWAAAKTAAVDAATAASSSASAASTSEGNASTSAQTATEQAALAEAAAQAALTAKSGVGALRDELGTAWIPIDTAGGQPVTIDDFDETGSSVWTEDSLTIPAGTGEGGYVTLSLSGDHTANNLSPATGMAARCILYGSPGVAEVGANVIFLNSTGGVISTTPMKKFVEARRYNSSATGQGVYGFSAENISIPEAATQAKLELVVNTSEAVAAKFWVAASPYGLENDPNLYALQTYALPRYALLTAKSASFTTDDTLNGYKVRCTAALTVTLSGTAPDGTQIEIYHDSALGSISISGATYNNSGKGTLTSRGQRWVCLRQNGAWFVN